MRITINQGDTFLIGDQLGNIPSGGDLGLFHDDTRFLSRYELLLDRKQPLALTARATEPYASVAFLTNPELRGAERGSLGIIRRQSLCAGLHEDLTIINHGIHEATFTVSLLLDADFAHLFQVKHNVEVKRRRIRRQGDFWSLVDGESVLLHYRYTRRGILRRLSVHLSEKPSRVDARQCSFDVRLSPRMSWTLRVDCIPSDGIVLVSDDLPASTVPPFAQSETPCSPCVRQHVAMVQQAPALATDSQVLQRAYAQTVRDFAALRLPVDDDDEFAIAAGIPWFMALFGRDSLIAAYQSLPFYPDAAKGTLRALAHLQGTSFDPVRMEEPGKILHEHRHNPPRSPISMPGFPYYGTIDATPLFLMLLAAVYQTTGDLAFVRSLREPALRALEWMERYGDRDGDGYLEYKRQTARGIENQGKKNSYDAIRFRDGSLASAPIALCEVQGYAYAARLGMATVFDALGESWRAAALRADAAQLKARFNRDFWLPDRGYYAFALDAGKRPVDAITSNPGHLLWTGILDEQMVEPVVARLLSPDLFSGWGIRTMASSEGGYNPLSYHCGSVWPHDNSLIVAGLARYGYTAEAARVAGALLDALNAYPDVRLPELFAGYSRDETGVPVDYPTANRPQAWASCAVFLLVATMAAAQPLPWDDESQPAATRPQPFLPDGIGQLHLKFLWHKARLVAVSLQRKGGRVTCSIHHHIDRKSAPTSARTA